jgi:4-hydroxy-tetrahydrodipicolinate synthase
MPRFGDGVYTVVPTPFDDGGELDLKSLERLTEFLVGLEVDGLLILGVMGEAPKLVGPERNQVIETVISRAGDAVPVIVGTSHPSERGAREFSKVAQDLGAAGVMIAPPRLPRDNQDETVRYLERTVEGVSVDVVLQDHPASSGVTLSAAAIVDLVTRVPAVRHVKLEDPPTPRKVAELRRLAGKGVGVYGGLGGVFFLEELRAGANGTMTGFAFPEVLGEVFRAYRAGDSERAAVAFYRALPLIRFEFQDEVGLAVRKRIYRLRGAIDHDGIRPPGTELDETSARELQELLGWFDRD